MPLTIGYCREQPAQVTAPLSISPVSGARQSSVSSPQHSGQHASSRNRSFITRWPVREPAQQTQTGPEKPEVHDVHVDAVHQQPDERGQRRTREPFVPPSRSQQPEASGSRSPPEAHQRDAADEARLGEAAEERRVRIDFAIAARKPARLIRRFAHAMKAIEADAGQADARRTLRARAA